MEDALAFGGACISLLNHADRVKVACLAQLVNVIAPIMTETGGPAWRQTIFHPFAHFSNFGRGMVLRAQIDVPGYRASYYDPRGTQELYFPVAAPYLKLAAVRGDASLTLFALNRHLSDEMQLDVALPGFRDCAVHEAWEMHDGDLQAVNSKAAPERVRATPLRRVNAANDRLRGTLAPASWNVIRLTAH